MNAEPIGDRRRFDRLPGDGWAYALIDEGVRIEFRRVRTSYHQVHAEVDVRLDWAGASHYKGSLSCADLNLSDQRARESLAAYCGKRAKTRPNDFDWSGVINAACIETIIANREGETPIVLDDAIDRSDRDAFIVHGIGLPDAVSMIIAAGDSLKSLILMLVAGTLAQRGIPVLFCDWEWTADRHKNRKRKLFGFERLDHLHYLRCHSPLTVEADGIRRYCDEHAIQFVCVDSVALACDGKLADDDTAVRFHRVLANLPPSLCAAHIPKSSIGADAKATVGPFGSVFFANLARMTWRVTKTQGASDDVVTVGLIPEKQNDGQRAGAVGLEFSFTPDRIHVRNVNMADVEGLAERLPLHVRMAHALKRGPMTAALLASELGAKVDSVDKATRRGQSLFTKVLSADGIARIALVERRIA